METRSLAPWSTTKSLIFGIFQSLCWRNAVHSWRRRGRGAALRSALGRHQGQVGVCVLWVYRDRDKRFLWESTPLKWAAEAPCWTGQLWRQRELLGFIGCDSLLMFACRHTSANEASMENRNMWMSAGINNSHKNVFGIRPKLLCGKHAFQSSQIQFDSLWLISLCCTVWAASSFNSDVID